MEISSFFPLILIITLAFVFILLLSNLYVEYIHLKTCFCLFDNETDISYISKDNTQCIITLNIFDSWQFIFHH